MGVIDYKKIYAKKKDYEKQIKEICPTMDNSSGIYFYIREDEDSKKYAYIGQAQRLLSRCASHSQGWNQRIDVSIKKRGFHSVDNPYGWKLNFLHFPEQLLNEKEKYYIKLYMDAGYELYNVESGSKVSKTDINERKLGKGYYDGLKMGYLRGKREVAHWFDKSLTYDIKGKPNKNKEKAMAKFKEFINIEKEDKGKNDD